MPGKNLDFVLGSRGPSTGPTTRRMAQHLDTPLLCCDDERLLSVNNWFLSDLFFSDALDSSFQAGDEQK